jgi:hypothetical protein
VHGNDTAALLLERAAGLAVQASIARAAHLRAVAAFVARSHAALGPLPDDAFGLDAVNRAEAQHAAVAELAARLVLTELAAYRLVALALALTTRLPVTFAAFAEGRIDEQRAALVAHETELLSDAHAAVVDEAIAGALGPLDTANLRPEVKREVETVDPEAVKRRARRATADRHVRFKTLANGMAEVTINAPATVLVPAYNTIEALAKDKDRPGGRVDPFAALVHDGDPPLGPDGTPLDRRSADAHRADVAVDLLTQGLGESVPSGCGPQIFVTFPAAVGADDQPARLDRGGDVPAIFARHLLADHGFRRVLTDPFTGHLLGVDGHSHPAGALPDLSRSGQNFTSLADVHLPVRRVAPRAAVGGGLGAPAARCLQDTTVAPPTGARRDPAAGPDRADGAHAGSGPDGGSGLTASHAPADDGEGLVPGVGCPVAATGGGRYEPGAAVLRFVHARSPRCTAPQCRRPSKQCDVDHRIPWPQGPTCPCNLAPLCRRHHLAKHRFGWAVRKASPDPADPSQHWTSPLRYAYVVPAEPLLPVGTAAALAREREVPSETWPGDSVDRHRPYGTADWLGRINAQQAQIALEGPDAVPAPPPVPTLPPSAPSSPPDSAGGRDGPDDARPSDDPSAGWGAAPRHPEPAHGCSGDDHGRSVTLSP